MRTRAVLRLGLATGMVVAMTSPRSLPLAAGQQGPPSAPPSTAPPSEPVQLHAPPPHPPADFEGPQHQVARPRRFDARQTRTDAEELAALAGKIPSEVNQVSQGMLPKDVARQLKEIQKLAKRLQAEIAP